MGALEMLILKTSAFGNAEGQRRKSKCYIVKPSRCKRERTKVSVSNANEDKTLHFLRYSI